MPILDSYFNFGETLPLSVFSLDDRATLQARQTSR